MRNVLAMILSLGNYLNADNKFGCAYGFKVGLLLKYVIDEISIKRIDYVLIHCFHSYLVGHRAEVGDCEGLQSGFTIAFTGRYSAGIRGRSAE